MMQERMNIPKPLAPVLDNLKIFRPSAVRCGGTLNRQNFCGVAAGAALLAILLTGQSAMALSGSWSATAATGVWDTNTNWFSNFLPGTTTIANPPANVETATFLSSSQTSVTLAADRNLANINFGAAATALSSFTIGTVGGNNLVLTSGASNGIKFLGNVTPTGITETINAPIVIGGGAGTQTAGFINDNATASNILVFGGSVSGGTTAAATLKLNGVNTGANTVNGLISNGSSSGLLVSKLSTGTWILANANNIFSGGVTIGEGTVSVASIGNSGSNSALGTNGTIKLGGVGVVGTLLYTGGGETSDKVISLVATGSTGGGTIDQSGTGLLKFTGNAGKIGATLQTLTLQGSTAGTGEIAGNITNSAGTLAVNKAGNGTWTLSGAANTYSGATTVTAGTLLINGSSNASAVTVSNAGTVLGGTGTIAPGASKAFTVNTGAIVNPGVGLTAGQLTISLSNTGDSAVFDGGAKFAFGLAASGTSDVLAFTGLTLNATTDVTFNSNVVDFTDLGGLAINNTYTLFTFDQNNAYSGTLFIGTGLESYSTSYFTYNAGNIQLTVVPEPTTLALLAAGLTVVSVFRRRRQSQWLED